MQSGGPDYAMPVIETQVAAPAETSPGPDSLALWAGGPSGQQLFKDVGGAWTPQPDMGACDEFHDVTGSTVFLGNPSGAPTQLTYGGGGGGGGCWSGSVSIPNPSGADLQGFIDVSHGLGEENVTVTAWDDTSNELVFLGTEVKDADTLTVYASKAGTYNLTICPAA